jgi:hypothetical protein
MLIADIGVNYLHISVYISVYVNYPGELGKRERSLGAELKSMTG